MGGKRVRGEGGEGGELGREAVGKTDLSFL